jgi:hypothetical protein
LQRQGTGDELTWDRSTQKSKANTSLLDKNPKNCIRLCVLEIYTKFIFVNSSIFFVDGVYSTVLSQPQCFWLKKTIATTTLLGKTPIS